MGSSISRIYTRHRVNDSAIGLFACPPLRTIGKYILELHEQIDGLRKDLNSDKNDSLQQALEEDLVGRVYNLHSSHYFSADGKNKHRFCS